MVELYHDHDWSRHDSLKEVPIRNDWVDQHLIFSHGERIRIIGMPTTYAKLLDNARRGFGIDQYVDLTFLVKHLLPGGNFIEAELDESAYHLLKNETQIRCVDTITYLAMKRQAPSAANYWGRPYGTGYYPTNYGSKPEHGTIYPLNYAVPVSYSSYGTMYTPTVGTIPAGQKNNITGKATTGQSSEQVPVKEPERDPIIATALAFVFAVPSELWWGMTVLASHCSSDEPTGGETSTQVKQSGADDASDNDEKLTPTTSEGNWNSTLTGNSRNDQATWAKGSQDGWSNGFMESDAGCGGGGEYEDILIELFRKHRQRLRQHGNSISAMYGDPFFPPMRPRDVMEKPKGEVDESPSVSGQTSEGREPATEEAANKEKQASDEKESNASLSSWIPVLSWEDMKKSAENSRPSSYKATVEDYSEDYEVHSRSFLGRAESGGDLGFGSSSSSVYE